MTDKWGDGYLVMFKHETLHKHSDPICDLLPVDII